MSSKGTEAAVAMWIPNLRSSRAAALAVPLGQPYQQAIEDKLVSLLEAAGEDAGQVESLWVSEQIGHPVIKAWNNVLAPVLAGKGLPAGAAGRIALSVAGDDPAAKKAVMSLVEDTGFDAIDAGSLAESWRQQPITRAYCSELTADELRAALAAADRARAPQLREEMVKQFMALGDKITTGDIVRLHRDASAKA